MDSIDFWAHRVRELETEIDREQHRILGGTSLETRLNTLDNSVTCVKNDRQSHHQE